MATMRARMTRVAHFLLLVKTGLKNKEPSTYELATCDLAENDAIIV